MVADNDHKLGTMAPSAVGQIIVNNSLSDPIWGTVTSPNSTISIGTTTTGITLDFNPTGTPTFLAIQTFNAPNVTGDNTVYYLGTAQGFTEIFDNSSSFTVGGGGTRARFTAPVTAKYYLEMLIQATNLPVPPPPPAPTPRCPMDIITTARTYSMEPLFLGSSVATTQSYAFSVIANMTAGDTCDWSWNLLTAAGTKTVGCGTTTFLCGNLVVRG
jgi:hypothetical protein